jgi:hypothetical protein
MPPWSARRQRGRSHASHQPTLLRSPHVDNRHAAATSWRKRRCRHRSSLIRAPLLLGSYARSYARRGSISKGRRTIVSVAMEVAPLTRLAPPVRRVAFCIGATRLQLMGCQGSQGRTPSGFHGRMAARGPHHVYLSYLFLLFKCLTKCPAVCFQFCSATYQKIFYSIFDKFDF